MEEIRQILLHKLNFMRRLREHPDSTHAGEEAAEELLKERRKQNSRDVLESRLMQTLATRRGEGDLNAEQFFLQSVGLMQLYDPEFQFAVGQSDDHIGRIVAIYVQFFTKQGCTKRAQELQQIYDRKLCQRAMIIPTVYNWFAEWLKKVYREFIKAALQRTTAKIDSSLASEQRLLTKMKIDEEIRSRKGSLSVIESRVSANNETTLPSVKSKLLQPNLKIMREVSRSEMLSCRNSLALNESPPVKEAMRGGGRQAASRVGEQASKQKHSNLNKDIFFSAFFQQIGCYYKLMACIGGLDEHYYRGFRKVDRREEISKNINILTKSLLKHQPDSIRDTIQDYHKSYILRFGKKAAVQRVRRSEPLKSKPVLVPRQPSITHSDSGTSLVKEEFHHIKMNFYSESRYSKAKQQGSLFKLEAGRKVIDLELPEIRSTHAKPLQKVIVVAGEYPLHSYDQLRARASADIYRELKGIKQMLNSANLSASKESSPALEPHSRAIKYRRATELNAFLDDTMHNQESTLKFPKIRH